MKYYTFFRENNNFDDILSDNNIKKKLRFKIKWYCHLVIAFEKESDEQFLGYLILKFGDSIKDLTNFDYTPKPYIDYTPIGDKRKSQKV